MRYCIYCGRMLEDDEECTCDDAVRKKQQNSNFENFQNAGQSQDFQNAGQSQNFQNAGHTVFHTALHNVIPFLKALVKAPAAAITTCVDNHDLPLACIIYIMNILSLILCEIITVSKLMNLFSSITSFLSLTGQNLIKVSYGWIILCSFLFAIVKIVIPVVLLYLACICFKSKHSLKQVIAGGCSLFVYPTICNLLASVLIFLSPIVAVCVLVIGNLAYLMMFFFTLKTILHKDDNSIFLLTSVLLVSLLNILVTLSVLKLSFSFSTKMVRYNESAYGGIINSYDSYYDDDSSDEDFWDSYGDYFGE